MYPIKQHVFLLADSKADYFAATFKDFTALAVRGLL
jgi:hypothetical protein